VTRKPAKSAPATVTTLPVAFTHRWRAAVLGRACTLTSTQRLTFVTLAQFADSNGGSCFPSTSTIAKCAGLSDKAVQRALIVACELGWVSRWNRPGSKGKNWRADAYEYQLMMPQGEDSQSPPSTNAEVTQSPAPAHAGDSVSNAGDCESNAGVPRSADLALDLVHYQEKNEARALLKDPLQEEACSASVVEGEVTLGASLGEIAMEAVGAYNTILARKHDLPLAFWGNGKTRTAESKDALPIIRELIEREQYLSYTKFFEAYFNECTKDSWLRGDGEYDDGRCPVRFAYLMQPHIIEKVYDVAKAGERAHRGEGASGRVARINAQAERRERERVRPQDKPFPETPPPRVLTEAEREAKDKTISEGLRRLDEALRNTDRDKDAAWASMLRGASAKSSGPIYTHF